MKQEILSALKVLIYSVDTRNWLLAHDPKALEQADAAVAHADAELATIECPTCGF